MGGRHTPVLVSYDLSLQPLHADIRLSTQGIAGSDGRQVKLCLLSKPPTQPFLPWLPPGELDESG